MQTMREKKAEEQEITLLQSNATVNQPNTSIINKLKQEMLKLQEMKVRIQQTMKEFKVVFCLGCMEVSQGSFCSKVELSVSECL